MDETTFFKKIVLRGLGLIIILSLITFGIKKCTQTAHVEDAVVVYEEFQEIYNTCSKLNTDLCNMQSIPESDKMFEQFSKAQRVNQIKTNLNRWVEDYNAKSNMFGRSLWKSSSLPYQLNTNQFSCN